MNKLVCIVGQTGTGKTSRAIELSKKSPSILVSADSRQVYRGMDIVTGKDHPNAVKIYGIDIVDPDEPCSVSVWYDSVMPHIERAWAEGKQVIVVGGTGLYVKALTAGIETMKVPINPSLRSKLALLSTVELQEKLKQLDSSKLETMNRSDSLNPRRLIRAIEVSSSPREPLTSKNSILESSMIGFKYSDDSIQRNKIHDRVLSRLSLGAIEETQTLLSKYAKSLPSMSAIGYKSIISYLEGNYTKDKMIASWVEGEISYAKRQLTWFRKQPVIWYDIDNYGNKKD